MNLSIDSKFIILFLLLIFAVTVSPVFAEEDDAEAVVSPSYEVSSPSSEIAADESSDLGDLEDSEE